MEKMLNPENVLSQIEIKEGFVVADFGSGAGHFSIEAAVKVGKDGIVYSIDILDDFSLGSVRSLANSRGLSNIKTIWADLEKTSKLEAGTCDTVLLVNLLFQIEKRNRESIIKEAHKILKEGGRVLVADWKLDSQIGPPKNQRISKEEVKMLFEGHFKFEKELSVADSHWAMIFSK